MNPPIYLVLSSYFPTPTSWRCAFVYDQVQAIRRTGKYRVIVINPMVAEDYVYQGVEVWACPMLRRGTFLCPWFFNWLNFRRLTKVLQAHGVDQKEISVIHGHMVTMISLGLWLKKRNPKILTICQSHDPDVYKVLLSSKGGNFKKIFYFLYHRSLMERTDVALSISDNVSEMLQHMPNPKAYRGYAPLEAVLPALQRFRSPKLKHLIRLHNGVDTRMFNPKGRENFPHDSKMLRIGCIGNFIDWKDQITLLRALAQIREQLGAWHLTFVGSGELKPACEAFVSEQHLEEHVTFKTEVDHTQLPDFYRSQDLFVMPSYFEGFGCVFTEAWACGAPFITCEGQGMDDFISPEDRHLWLCKQQDPEDLAKKILYFAQHRPEQRLTGSVDIDDLVPHFLEQLEPLKP